MYSKIEAAKLLQHHIFNDHTILSEISKNINPFELNQAVRQISDNDYLEYIGNIDGITQCSYLHRDNEGYGHFIDFTDLLGITDDKHLATMRSITMEERDNSRSQLHENHTFIQEKKYSCLLKDLGIEFEYKPQHSAIITRLGYRPSFYLPKMRVFDEQDLGLGLYLDIVNPYEPMNQNKRMKDNANSRVFNAFELPHSESQNPFELDPFQLVSSRYTFMSHFGEYVLAEPHYHTMNQGRLFLGQREKGRMEICFEAANKIEERFENSPPADLS
jgi:hypothetical protein